MVVLGLCVITACQTHQAESRARVGRLAFYPAADWDGLHLKFKINGLEVRPGSTVTVSRAESTNIVVDLWIVNCYPAPVFVHCNGLGSEWDVVYRGEEMVTGGSVGALNASGAIPYRWLFGRDGLTAQPPLYPVGGSIRVTKIAGWKVPGWTSVSAMFDADVRYYRLGDTSCYTNSVCFPLIFQAREATSKAGIK